MKILWIVNIKFPYVCEKLGIKNSVFGGWLNGLYNSIIKNNDIELAIATVYNGKELLKYNDGKTSYYLVPYKNIKKYDKKSTKYFIELNDDFKPDLVHIHGTEYPYGLVFINSCSNVKSVVSIQGLVSQCSKSYLGGLTNTEIIKNITFRDIIKFNNLFQQKKEFSNRSKFENEILNKCDYVIGRTTWDKCNSYAINFKNNYLKCNESLRDTFYEAKWNIEDIKRYSIFVSQASYPIKGFHILLDAIKILKIKYPDVIVYVAGKNLLDRNTFYKKIKRDGYSKLISKKIKKYNLTDNIKFTGLLNEKEMVEYMLQSNVFVIPSIIENSPNSMGEAMLLGMPIVASYVGGIPDLLDNINEGLLYNCTEPSILSDYIDRIFSDDEFAYNIGNNARKHALLTHDRKKNSDDMMKIYRKVIKEMK